MAGGLIDRSSFARAALLEQLRQARLDAETDERIDARKRARQKLLDAGWSSDTADNHRDLIASHAEDTSAYHRLGHLDPLSDRKGGRKRDDEPRRTLDFLRCFLEV